MLVPTSAASLASWSFTKTPAGWVWDQGRPWMAPDDPWVVAHDVVHHRLDDVGDYADEVASMGAQWYVEQSSVSNDEDFHDLVLTWHSVMMIAFEHQGPQGWQVSKPADEGLKILDLNRIDQALINVWDRAHRAAYQETLAEVGGARGVEWPAQPSEAYRREVLAHMAAGWSAARRRWPQDQQAQQVFDAIVQALPDAAAVGHRVHLNPNSWQGWEDLGLAESTRPADGPGPRPRVDL